MYMNVYVCVCVCVRACVCAGAYIGFPISRPHILCFDNVFIVSPLLPLFPVGLLLTFIPK